MRSGARDGRDLELSGGNADNLVVGELIDLFLLARDPAAIFVGERVTTGVLHNLESVVECSKRPGSPQFCIHGLKLS